MSGEGDTQCDCNKQESLQETCENGSNVEMYCEERIRSVLTHLNNVYEERIIDIDREATGDYKLKCLTYKEWIQMLQFAMKDMIASLEDLETEAVDRIHLLEKKLEHEKQNGHQYLFGNCGSDIKSFVKFIKKNINKGVWNSMECDFLRNNLKEILFEKGERKVKTGNEHNKNLPLESNEENTKRNSCEISPSDMFDTSKDKADKDEQLLHTLAPEYIENQAAKSTSDEELKLLIKELNDYLKEKDQKIVQLEKDNECLKSELGQYKCQSIERDKAVTSQRALAFEVAEKHDQIQEMRTQIISLEEELKRAHKKVQFKDNVIRDLRRECKTFAKCGEIERILPPRSYSLTFEEESNSLRSEFSDFSDAMSRGTDISLDSIIDNKADMLRALQMEEADCTKILSEHLEEIFEFQNTHNEAIEDRNNMLSAQQKKFRDLIRSLTRDLAKTRGKFASISEKLGLLLGTDTSSSIDSIMDKTERSPDNNIDPESELINVIRVQIENLKDENLKLKSQLEKVEANPGTFLKEDKNKKIIEKTLRGLATIICNVRRKEEEVENLLTNPENEQIVHPLCEAMANLASEILENSKNVEVLKQTIDDNKKFVDYLQNQKNSLEQECSEKHNLVTDLQQKVKNYEDALEKLRQLNEEFQTELNLHKETAKLLELNTAEMLKAKIKLERECQHQLTTISNLRMALEECKRNNNGVRSNSVSSTSTSTTGSSSLWGWWRNNNVHDV